MNQQKTLLTRDEATDDDLVNLINHTVQSALEDSVQDTVDTELLLMMRGDGFKTRINDLIDARLHALAEEITVKMGGAGPGRGHTGRTHKKISLSLPNPLFDQVKQLPGYFSCHVAAALELYLKLHKR